MRFCVWIGALVLLVALAASGNCQVSHAWVPGNPPGVNSFCQPQLPQPRPVVRTVQVDVPTPCAPPMRFMAAPVCGPYPCCAPPCPTRPVRVRVEVVVRPEGRRPCCPQRDCCENPPVFEPIFYHAAWMLKSIVAAPLGLGDCMLGHGAIHAALLSTDSGTLHPLSDGCVSASSAGLPAAISSMHAVLSTDGSALPARVTGHSTDQMPTAAGLHPRRGAYPPVAMRQYVDSREERRNKICTCKWIFAVGSSHCSEAARGGSVMRSDRSWYGGVLHVFVLAIALGAMALIPANAQENTVSRELERVEVLPPDRRPSRAPATRSDTGTESDQVRPSDFPAPSESDQGSRATGTISPSTQALVAGKSEVSLGAASLPAQVQTITPQDIQQLNVRGDYANLFRRTAGVKAINYGQGQIGTMINMRGFKSSAGNEVAVFIDGVPQNYPSLTMNHGASEISWLSPELIEKIEIIKGPFSAIYGDFALGGVVNIVTKKSDPAPSVKAEGGSFGNFRTLGIVSSDAWIPTPLLAEDYYTINGYRDNSQLNQWSPFNKVSCPVWGGVLSLRYNYFHSDWGAPGYWPIDWVKSGRVNRTQEYNPTDGGRNQLFQLVLNYAPACGERGLYVTLYRADFHHKRFYKFLPTTGSQSGRQDDRQYWGGRAVPTT